MSKFMDFYSHVTGNADTTKKLTELMSKFDGDSDRDVVLEELIVFAKEEGFDFGKAEVKAFLEGMTAAGELSDDELEAVAGGKVGSEGGCAILGFTADGEFKCFVAGAFDKGGCVGVGAGL